MTAPLDLARIRHDANEAAKFVSDSLGTRVLEQDVPALIAAVEAAFARANEAARLSAQARDDADALRTVIGALREQIEIVESDRTDFDEWTLRVATKHGLPDDDSEPELRDRIARYLDEVLAERDRLGNEANRIAQVAKQFRAERDAYRAVVDAARAWRRSRVGSWRSADHALAAAVDALPPCCDLHGRNCEPPSELCCHRCTEASHPEHRDGSVCSAPDLSRLPPEGPGNGPESAVEATGAREGGDG